MRCRTTKLSTRCELAKHTTGWRQCGRRPPTTGHLTDSWSGLRSGHWYLAEDFAFCHRARQVGLKIMTDTTIRLWRVGTYGYGWEEAGSDPERFDTFHFRVE